MSGPHPTNRYGLLRIPAPAAISMAMRYAPLAGRDKFNPAAWPRQALTKSAAFPGWWEMDLDAMALADGPYEYEFMINGIQPAADPYADEITRFGGYRGMFAIANGERAPEPFRWDDEFQAGKSLPQNNQIVIYEMPLKWMSSSVNENPLVELGTFDKVIFEHLDDLAAMGVNCIELLPIEDSPQTLNWGYGTRFFFSPDYDMGSPVSTKFFIKCCHQRGIRVLLDVVMNFFAPSCPLAILAPEWFSEPAVPGGRNPWGQILFRFNTPPYNSYYAAREFLCEMAEFWVAEYHVDGFRIDDFADISNWDFIKEFRDRATAANQLAFPGKPFLVVAEDSNRRFEITGPIVDGIWNFGYRDELRRLATDTVDTLFGQPARSTRLQHMISKDGVWNNWGSGGFDAGYADLACAVDYATSHDVADAPRMMNIILGPMLRAAGLGDGSVPNVRAAVDNPWSDAVRNTVDAALRRIFGVFAILMTSVGMPMFLAGEEFGDVHDTDYNDVNTKQEDPVQWARAQKPAHAALRNSVGSLIKLRTTHPALQRNEVEFFYFHPQFDDNGACRVFAYCRTAGRPLGGPGQMIVIANMGAQSFSMYNIPGWPWSGAPLDEVGYPNSAPVYNATPGTLSLELDPFAVRVFTS